MRNWIRTAVISAVVALSGGAAWGFDASDFTPRLYPEVPLGRCTVEYGVDISKSAFLILRNDGVFTTGGDFWESATRTTYWAFLGEVTAARVAMCLVTDIQNITNVTQKGADAASFAEQEYMGFSFTLTEDAGGLNAGSHAYYIGKPPADVVFSAEEEEITQVITDDAQRSLNSTLASNTRLTRDARGRFLTSRTQMQSDDAGIASRNNIALDVDGTAVASADQIATQGTFFAQTGNFEGTQRRLVFGDFDVQHDGDTGSTTATINGKIAWEQMLSEQTMLGYYLGGEVARSSIRGSFTGNIDKYGVSVGGYFVHALQENLFLDGFASLGAGRNNLEIADDTLDLTSNYTTQTVTLGAAVSGVIEHAGYDILPELSVTYGKTTIGNVGFTGVAYGKTDNTLNLDAGSVSTATIMFRPEFRVPMDGLAASESRSVFSFAPRVMCERVKVASTTDNCGGGLELGFTSGSQDGLTALNATIIADRVGNSTRRSLQFNIEHQF